MTDWTSKRVQVGKVNLHYRTAGEGPVLVLLHGFPQHSLMWHKIGPILAERFTVIALDQRGVGMSTITADGYDGTTMAADLKGLLDAIGVEKAFLAGYDLGTRTAAAFARDYPERVERVAFMEFTLPTFGYEQAMAPTKDWDLNANWHLALFTVPDAAEFLFRGRERRDALVVVLPHRLFGQCPPQPRAFRGLRSRDLQARRAQGGHPLLCRGVEGCRGLRHPPREAADHAGAGDGRRGVDRAVSRHGLEGRRRRRPPPR